MRQAFLGVCVWLTAGWAWADESNAPPSDAKGAIERGLAFLAKDAVAWRETRHCASCHHPGLMVWALNEAKLRGFAVDEPVRVDLTELIATSGDDAAGRPKPEGAPRALNTKALYFALALVADPGLSPAAAAGLKHELEIVRGDQLDDGSWQTWPDMRPPMIGPSHEMMTLLAALALTAAAAGGDQPARAASDRAFAWLSANPTDDDPQSIALRLVLWRRLGRPAGEWEPLVEKIRQRQNADGGWSQTPEMASDAWASGQALYALAQADVKPDDPAIERGRGFLVATQREDGSWPMTSRPLKPDGDGAKNLVPITGVGAAWGVIGLVRSQ